MKYVTSIMSKKKIYILLLLLLPLSTAVALFVGVTDDSKTAVDKEKAENSGEIKSGSLNEIGENLTPRERMVHNFRRTERLHIILGGSTKTQSDLYRNKINNMRWVRYLDSTSTFDHQNYASSRRDRPAAKLLIGTAGDHPLIKKILENSNLFHLTDEGFRFDGTAYNHPDHTLTTMLPDPENPGWPVFILTGNSKEAVGNQSARRGLTFNYQILKRGERIRFGSFMYGDGQKHLNVKIDRSTDRNVEQDLQLVQKSEHFNLHLQRQLNLDEKADKIIQHLERRYDALLGFLELEPGSLHSKIDYYVYRSFEDQALFSDFMEFSAIAQEKNSVHTVIRPGFRGDSLAGEVPLILHNLLGEPAHQLLETGIRMKFVSRWHGSNWKEMGARIARTEYDLELSRLFEPDFWERQSSLWQKPVAGMVVSFLLDYMGKEKFLAFYEQKQNTATPDWSKLEPEWKQYLTEFKENHPPNKKFGNLQLPAFLKGFNFAHEGYQIVNGYGSEVAEESLGKLKQLGGNTVALNPFGFSREAKKPARIHFSDGVGSENDASVLHALLTARSMELTVFMKPHIWIRGTWPGEIEMETEQEWQQFLAYYEQWIRHYAIFSQLYEVPILSIGLEMSKATTSHEKEFVDMVERLRKIYDGNITYAANWYGEFDKLTFWNAFDFIGIDSYYPLSKEKDSNLSELIEGAEDAADNIGEVAQKYNKEVLVTEIGFTSTPTPWIDPHKYGRGQKVNLEHQERSYRAIRDAWRDEPWLRGIYWWKWPTTPDRAGALHSGFTPRDKPAENVVKQWFRSE